MNDQFSRFLSGCLSLLTISYIRINHGLVINCHHMPKNKLDDNYKKKYQNKKNIFKSFSSPLQYSSSYESNVDTYVFTYLT